MRKLDVKYSKKRSRVRVRVKEKINQLQAKLGLSLALYEAVPLISMLVQFWSDTEQVAYTK